MNFHLNTMNKMTIKQERIGDVEEIQENSDSNSVSEQENFNPNSLYAFECKFTPISNNGPRSPKRPVGKTGSRCVGKIGTKNYYRRYLRLGGNKANQASGNVQQTLIAVENIEISDDHIDQEVDRTSLSGQVFVNEAPGGNGEIDDPVVQHVPVLPEQPRHACDICKTSYSTHRGLIDHSRRLIHKLAVEKAKKHMEYCGNGPNDMANFAHDRNDHNYIQRNMCDVCKVAFKGPGSFQRHFTTKGHIKKMAFEAALKSTMTNQ